ncbi:DUF1922 domain-containing protein [Mycolicibacterium sp. XJ1819]
MNLCQQCKRPEPHTYLCENCTTQLANMLHQLPWLITELDNRIQQLTRTTHGTIGRNRRPANELNAIDFDAADTARKTRKTLLHWVTEIAQKATGRTPPALHTATTTDLAKWLYANVNHIARLDLARRNHKGHTTGHRLYHDIEKLVGTNHQRTGTLIKAINPTERHFAGLCHTITGHNHQGEPIHCQTTLYADVDETTITCPTCKQPIDVEKNRRDTEIDRDLMTEPKLLEVLADLDEKVSRVKLYQWIREKRIRPKGWIHDGRIVQYRIRRGDPAVYSLARARKLRAREQQRQEANAQ